MYSQSLVDIYSYSSNTFSNMGYVNNVQNQNSWNLSLTFAGTNSNSFTQSLYSLSLEKEFPNQLFYVNYTPGIEREFQYTSNRIITIPDSTETSTTNNISYKQIFSAGYSKKLFKNFNLGVNISYLKQKYSEEAPQFVFDSLNYSIAVENIETESNLWKGDISLSYRLFADFKTSLYSVNLFTLFERDDITEENIKLVTDKHLGFSINYNPIEQIGLNASYETNSSFSLGSYYKLMLSENSLQIGFLLLKDKYQSPFFNSIFPLIKYQTELYSISFSGIKYFSDRKNNSYSLTEFLEEPINNINHNTFSYDKFFITASVSLSFKDKKKLNLLDVEISEAIYPVLSEEYLNKPIAFGKIVNISDNPVNINASCIIENVTKTETYSPLTKILPGDTLVIPFYITLDDDKKFSERIIAQAKFLINVDDEESIEEISKPIMINNKNNWDGKVKNLRFFIRDGFEFAHAFSKKIIQDYKDSLFNKPSALQDFYKTKYLFNNLIQNMTYVSDPRASVERVQYPSETIELKGGDCDDLSVCFSSLLESVGIQTALVDYKEEDGVSHVNLLVNTKLYPEHSSLVTINDNKYFVRRNSKGEEQVWIPIELTELTNFNNAWESGSKMFYDKAILNYGLSKSTVVINEVY